jgi:hypothetical protein
VVVLTGFVVCGVCICGFCNVLVYVCMGFVMYGCFGNMCTSISVFLYCFVYVHLFFLCFCLIL